MDIQLKHTLRWAGILLGIYTALFTIQGLIFNEPLNWWGEQAGKYTLMAFVSGVGFYVGWTGGAVTAFFEQTFVEHMLKRTSDIIGELKFMGAGETPGNGLPNMKIVSIKPIKDKE